MRRRAAFLLALLAVACAVAIGTSACGGSGPKFGAGVTAPDLVRALKAAGIPIGDETIYTRATDPNHLLGRLRGYTSKVNFRDNRIPLNGTDPTDVDAGGSVEVFSNVGDAKAREAYGHAITNGSALLAEYEYRRDLVFLRLSRELTQAQAQRYKAAFERLNEEDLTKEARKEAAVCRSTKTTPDLASLAVFEGDKPAVVRRVEEQASRRATPVSAVVHRLGRQADALSPFKAKRFLFEWWHWGNTAYFVAEFSANSLAHQYVLSKTCNWSGQSPAAE